MALTYLVGYDGSAASRSAIDFALLLARPAGAQVVAVTVEEDHARADEISATLDAENVAKRVVAASSVARAAPTGVPGAPDPTAGGRDEFEWMLGKVSFDTHGGAGHRLLTGRPGPALAAASADVDLLVAGSRGHGAIRGVVLGSVARHLVDHAACPVLVVPFLT